MLRPNVFITTPGRIEVTWYDFCMVAFDLCQRFKLMASFFEQNPMERENPSRSTLIALLNTIHPLCHILLEDDERYKLFLEDEDSHNLFIQMMDLSQSIIDYAINAQIVVTIKYRDYSEDNFHKWFDHHGKHFEPDAEY